MFCFSAGDAPVAGSPTPSPPPAAHAASPRDKGADEKLIAALLASPVKSRRPTAETPADGTSLAASSTVPSAPETPPRESARESSLAEALQLGSCPQVSRASNPSSAAAALGQSGGEQRSQWQPLPARQAAAQCAEPPEQRGQAQPLQATHSPADSAGGAAAQGAAHLKKGDVLLGPAAATKAAGEGAYSTPVAEVEAGLDLTAGRILGGQEQVEGGGAAPEANLETIASQAAPAQPCAEQEGQ